MSLIHVQIPQGANIIINNQKGTKPNHQNWKHFAKIKFSPTLLKRNPTLGFKQSRTKSKELKE